MMLRVDKPNELGLYTDYLFTKGKGVTVNKFLLTALAAFVLVVSGCTSPERYDWWRGKVETAGRPGVNQEVEILLTINPEYDEPSTSMRLGLSPGIELLSGDRIWRGDLKAGESATLKFRVKTTRSAQHVVRFDMGGRNKIRLYGLCLITIGPFGFVRDLPVFPFHYDSPTYSFVH